MRRTWAGILAVALLAVASCHHNTTPKITPPKRPDEYTLPPDEKRFSDPHDVYPKDTLNREKEKKDSLQQDIGPIKPVTPNRFGGGMGGQ
jgi:hypothetical protein